MNKLIPDSVANKFTFYNLHHAVEVISAAFPSEWKDIMDMLAALTISEDDLAAAGGSETNIPGKFEDFLYPRKWKNVQVSADLHVKFFDRVVDQKKYEEFPSRESLISDYMTRQQIDFLKGRTALYLEWNKKDVAFDKTLSDIRTLYESGIISAAVIVTRDTSLNEVFKTINDTDGKPIIRKYGASSTHMGKLLPRLDARQAGGCPVLAVGIGPACVEGYEE